ncbi:MAG TPA: M15 family metallopeptidase [Hyphomicrobiales bacterium]|nr:M15 family metallopeptidase [Hyphomicrobiales bacterium]
MAAKKLLLAALLGIAPAHLAAEARAQTLTQMANALIRAYPDHLEAFDGTSLIWKDGTKMPMSDGNDKKTPDELINRPDIKDMFTWPYIFGGQGLPSAKGSDPGRIRNLPFFEKMYGSCTARTLNGCGGVSCKLAGRIVSVPWVPAFGGGSIKATTVNGIDKALAAVSAGLERLGAAYKRYLVPPGGGFFPRCIAGTSRLSVHSFGIAFDINPAYGGYWQYGLGTGVTEQSFDETNRPLIYKNKIPLEIVEIFERHGFIWGGNWYHFDGMHFEYRPEFKALAEILQAETRQTQER